MAIDILYRIAGHEGIVGPHHPLWDSPLPAPGSKPPPITHAAYFSALHAYVTGPGRAHIRRALAARRPDRPASRSPDRVSIILEKHGAFYRPARLAVDLQGELTSLVLNVAVTATGRAWMASELAALPRVAARLPAGCLPAVYGQATVPGPDRAPLTMFLADWFDDFHEFHLSADSASGLQRTMVWDTTRAPFFLSEDQQAEVYRRTAYLLARAYDPVTTEQVYPWHHASGDFILRVDSAAVALRLVTVRQYAPTLAGDADNLDDHARLTALLTFFLNLTLRNRLDRLNGTGPLAWAGPLAVPVTVAGVLEALDAESAEALTGVVTSFQRSELIETLGALAERYRLMPMERDVIRANLAPHAELLLDTFRGRSRKA